MAIELSWADLTPFAPNVTEEQGETLIAATLGRAAIKAPCIVTVDFPSSPAAVDLIRVAVLRRIKAMGGRVVKKTSIGSVSLEYDGPLVDGIFTDSEISDLQALCRQHSGQPVSVAAPMFSMPDCAPRYPDPAERWPYGRP